MPLHVYTTDNRPPTNTDHTLAHPYAIGLSIWQALTGLLVVTGAITGQRFSSIERELPVALLAGVGAFMVYGGVEVIRGLLNDDDDLRCGFKIERGGLILSATAWLGYAVAMVFANPAGFYGYSLALVLVAVNICRLVAGRREEARIARAVHEHGT